MKRIVGKKNAKVPSTAPKVAPSIHVGEGARSSGRRFIAAWKQAEAGKMEPERHICFVDWDTLTQALTPKRLELIRYVRRNPVRRVTDLARALNRDYRNVHDDVAALTAAGLLRRSSAGLRADYREINTTIAV